MFNWLHRDCEKRIAVGKQLLDLLEKEKNDLSKTVSNMLTEINTQRGILEYSMHEKEQHIESLMAEIECLKKTIQETVEKLAMSEKYERHSEGQKNEYWAELVALRKQNIDLLHDIADLKGHGEWEGDRPLAARSPKTKDPVNPKDLFKGPNIIKQKLKGDADNAKKHGCVAKHPTNKSVK